jgi:ribosome-associated protein
MQAIRETAREMEAPRDVPIREETIRLGQLLKLAGLAESGAEARELVQDGAACVNGEVETRRGRQLRRGDVVDVAGDAVRVA